MSKAPAAVDAAAAYLIHHPDELGRILWNAIQLRIGMPVPALQYLLDSRGKGPKLNIEAVPPGIRISGDVDLMNTPVKAGASIFIDRLAIGPEEARMELRLEDVLMEVQGEAQTHVGALIQSGALDLTKAGSLAAALPDVKALMAGSHENRLVIDLMKHPGLASSRRFKAALALASSLVSVRSVQTDRENLWFGLKAFPRGVGTAFRALRTHGLALRA